MERGKATTQEVGVKSLDGETRRDIVFTGVVASYEGNDAGAGYYKESDWPVIVLTGSVGPYNHQHGDNINYLNPIFHILLMIQVIEFIISL